MLINKYLRANFIKDSFELFFPETCVNCHRLVEEPNYFICYICISEIPLTHFSFHVNNALENSFKGRVELVSGTSLFYFEKGGLAQQALHEIKYNQKPAIASFFGRWLGDEMVESGRFEGVDLILPLPLYKDKKRQRGYNQSEYFGRELAETLGKDYRDDILFRVTNRDSQTNKNRHQRMQVVENEYRIKDEAYLKQKHVLIVDDIITSGATLQSSSLPLLSVPDIQLSFASIAIAP